MFWTGNAEATIDPKGRLSIPARFRAEVDPERDGKKWVCVPWPGGVIRIYTETGFQALAASSKATLTPNQDQAKLQQLMFGLADKVEPDSVGRVQLPKTLLQRAKLEGEVVVIGAGDRLEVHDRKKWEATLEEQFDQLQLLVERIESRGSGGNV